MTYDKERYDRQLRVLGEEGQEKLKKSTVAVAGAGGLGSIVSLYLTAAGVGTIVLIDKGELELSNLNRQVLYTSKDLGKPKVFVAAERLQSLNPEVRVVPVKSDIMSSDALEWLKRSDVIVDCLDNWRSRLFLDKISWRNNIPLVHAGISEFYGQATTIVPKETGCLKCLLGIGPESEEAPPQVLGPTAGLLASIESIEAIKLITGIGEPLKNKLLVIDLKRMEFVMLNLRVREDCECW